MSQKVPECPMSVGEYRGKYFGLFREMLQNVSECLLECPGSVLELSGMFQNVPEHIPECHKVYPEVF